MRGPDKIKRVRRTKYSGAPTVTLPPADELGPAMRALTERQRRFVLELSTGPIAYGHLARAAKAAGYSDRGKNVLDTVAGHLLRSDKIQAALREIGIKIVRAEAFQAIRHVAAIAMNSKHKDQLKACVELMNRGGFSFEQQHNIAVSALQPAHGQAELDGHDLLVIFDPGRPLNRRSDNPRSGKLAPPGADALARSRSSGRNGARAPE